MASTYGPAPIILTGATGFIGTHVRRRLAEQRAGTELLTLDSRTLEGLATVPLVANSFDGTKHDLAALRNCTLVHLAWCSPGRERLGPHAQQVKLLAELLDTYANSFGRIIAFGSAEEYGTSCGHLQETDALNRHLSPYGWGKRAAQVLVESWCDLHHKPGLWLRPFLVYGEGQQGNMAIPYAVRMAMRQEVAEFSAGTQQRDFIHVDDVARAVGLAVSQSWDEFKIANLGTGIGTKLRDVLAQLAEQFGTTALFRYGVRSMRPGEPDVQIAETERATKLLGFKAQINLDEGLRRMKEHLQRPHDPI